jgi:hypothetical protein
LKRELYSAADIAAMHLPGLPTTKSNVIARAEKEEWYSEERTGVGGTRRVYEIPVKYLPGEEISKPTQSKSASLPGSKIAGTIAAGGKVDPELLQLVVQTLEDWAKERRVEIPSDRKAALIAVLYDYASKGANLHEMTRLLQAVG